MMKIIWGFNQLINELSSYVHIPVEILNIYVIILGFAVPIAYLFFFVLYTIYQVISYIGEYHKNNFWQIFYRNCFLTIFVYLTTWTILQPKENETVGFFFSSLIIIVAFLLSLRFLSIPTINGFFKLYEVWEDTAIPEKIKAKIIRFKENVIAFYFSIIAVSLFYVIMFWIFDLLNPLFSMGQSSSFECVSSPIWVTPLPPLSLENDIIFISAYIIALFIGTWTLEYYLRKSKPIKNLY